jgi:hypothetical protein
MTNTQVRKSLSLSFKEPYVSQFESCFGENIEGCKDLTGILLIWKFQWENNEVDRKNGYQFNNIKRIKLFINQP